MLLCLQGAQPCAHDILSPQKNINCINWSLHSFACGVFLQDLISEDSSDKYCKMKIYALKSGEGKFLL